MKVIAFDCSTELLALAVRTEAGAWELVRDVDLTHSAVLVRYIEYLLNEADVRPADLDLVAVARGPGSFTGLRIAFATAKGLCASTGCPMVSVPTLAVYGKSLESHPGPVLPLVDAKKGRYFGALFEAGARLTEDLDLDPRGIEERCRYAGRVLVTGPHAKKAIEALYGDRYVLDRMYRASRVQVLAEMALAEYTHSGADDPASAPSYVRLSDAEASRGG